VISLPPRYRGKVSGSRTDQGHARVAVVACIGWLRLAAGTPPTGVEDEGCLSRTGHEHHSANLVKQG
jgi:hypothetical protein